MAVALSLATLSTLPDRVGRPAYARGDLRPGSCISASATSTARICRSISTG